MDNHEIFTRFATTEDVKSSEFMKISRDMDKIAVKYDLPDHSDVNRERYPWATGLLSSPQFYAARMWEYPYSIISSELKSGMKCADIGCGMTAFTIYLKQNACCEVVGADPDIFDTGIRYKGHGVSREFLRKTGLRVVQCGMERIALSSNTIDRVFCLSVIEHVPPDIARRGVQEMARILKPGGRLIVTVDVDMHSETMRPLDLIWESGLIPLGEMDLKWPVRRFGISFDGRQSADVFGMTLVKDDYMVETQYSHEGSNKDAPRSPHSYIPVLRHQSATKAIAKRPLWRRIASRFKRALLVLLRG